MPRAWVQPMPRTSLASRAPAGVDEPPAVGVPGGFVEFDLRADHPVRDAEGVLVERVLQSRPATSATCPSVSISAKVRFICTVQDDSATPGRKREARLECWPAVRSACQHTAKQVTPAKGARRSPFATCLPASTPSPGRAGRSGPPRRPRPGQPAAGRLGLDFGPEHAVKRVSQPLLDRVEGIADRRDHAALALLPLHVGGNHAAGVGQDVRHDPNALAAQDAVGLPGRRGVGALDDQSGAGRTRRWPA